MDERILVEVYIPAVQQLLEVYLPACIAIGILHPCVLRLFEQLQGLETGTMRLSCWYAQQKHQNLSFAITLQQAGVSHGERIIIM